MSARKRFLRCWSYPENVRSLLLLKLVHCLVLCEVFLAGNLVNLWTVARTCLDVALLSNVLCISRASLRVWIVGYTTWNIV